MSPNTVRRVSAVDQMAGEDEEETALLRDHLVEATDYIRSFRWCRGIDRVSFGCGIGGVVAVFLFEIAPAASVDRELWVVVGDLPSAYLVIDRAPDPVSALEVYCAVMDDWARAVRHGDDLATVFPVRAEPNVENARALQSRLELLRSRIIPALREASKAD